MKSFSDAEFTSTHRRSEIFLPASCLSIQKVTLPFEKVVKDKETKALREISCSRALSVPSPSALAQSAACMRRCATAAFDAPAAESRRLNLSFSLKSDVDTRM